jgi:NAD(P)-dependent dehydrogenase (short-subunit alcohol dehydrogenase family)
LRLAGAGANIVVIGRDEERGSEVVGEITGAGGKASFIAHDLEDSDFTRLV